jgi:hypothetical protein
LTLPAEYTPRAERVRNNPGVRHRLRTIPCGTCDRPLFLDGRQRCPGKKEFKPPTLAGWFQRKALCPTCWNRIADGPVRTKAPRKRSAEAGLQPRKLAAMREFLPGDR